MNQSDLRAALLVKAVEETDRNGSIISVEQREQATRRALVAIRRSPRYRPVALRRRAGPSDCHRSEALLRDILNRTSSGRRARTQQLAEVDRDAVVGVAVVAGASVSDSPTDQSARAAVSGVIGWNIAAFTLCWRLDVHLGAGSPGIGRLLSIAANWVEHRLTELVSSTAQQKPTVLEVARRFFENWRGAAAAVFAQRLRMLLHAAAGCVGLGLIVGLYLHLARSITTSSGRARSSMPGSSGSSMKCWQYQHLSWA